MMSPAAEGDGQAGFTLVELLVAMSIVMVLASVAMATVVNSQEAVVTTKQLQDINEEARQAINRMARDVRQANRITTAVNPDGTAGALTALRFSSDFDGDTCTGGVPPSPAVTPAPVCLPYNPGNPEDITYCFQPGVRQLYVIDNQAPAVTPVTSTTTSCSGGQPLLAGNVVAFDVEYRSNQYRHDLSPSDGITTWQELDAAQPPVGNGNGLLDVEVVDVDAIVIEVVVELGGRQQEYRTQVDLRNRSR